jgi:hypothetical protein
MSTTHSVLDEKPRRGGARLLPAVSTSGGRSGHPNTLLGRTYGTRSGFRSTMEYLTHDHDEAGKQLDTAERVEWQEGLNLPTNDPRTVTKIMEATADQNVRATKPGYHFVLSWSADLTPTKAKQIEITKGVLERIGLDQHQAFLVSHGDTDKAHVHVLVNRVHPETGRVWRDGNDFARIERAIAQEAKARGLAIIPGRHNAKDLGIKPPRHTPDKVPEQRKAVRTGQQPFSDLVKEHVGRDFETATSWADLERRLADKGLQLQPKGQGLVVTDGQETTKASSIDRAASKAALEKRFGSYDQYRASSIDRSPAPELPGKGAPARVDRDREGQRPDDERLGGNAKRPDHDGPRDREPIPPDRGEGRRPGPAEPRPDARNTSPRPVVGSPGGVDGRGVDRGQGLENALPGRAPEFTLAEAIDRLARYNQVAPKLDQVKADVARLGKESWRMDSKAEWAEKVKSETIQQLEKVYSNPQEALEKIGREIDKHGLGRTSAKIERNPAAFGKLQGWQIGPIKSPARHAALDQLNQAARDVRRAASAYRAVKAEAPAREEIRDRLAELRGHERSLLAQIGGDKAMRWEMERDVEKAAKRDPAAVERLTPDQRRQFETVREMLQKRSEQRRQKVQDQDRQKSQNTGKGRGRKGPDFKDPDFSQGR